MQRIADQSSGDAPSRLRVIIVAYHYYPDPAVGSLRARNVAQALAAEGHEVHVVSIALSDAPAEAQDGLVHVVRVEPTISPRDVVAGISRGLSVRRKRGESASPGTGEQKSQESGWKGPEHVSRIRRWLGALTWFPDDRQGFIGPATRAVATLMRGNGSDVLYTTAPPFSDHVVGLLARRTRRFRWVVEFRDPWTGSQYKPWFVRSRLTDAAEAWVEKRCLSLSDGIVTVTGVYADILGARYGERVKEKLLVVLNGIPRSAAQFAEPVPTDASRFRIVYAGSFYLGRDPKPFLTALAAFHKRNGASPRRLDVQLVGDCRYFDGAPLAPLIEALGLSDVVTFVDWMPHKESVQLMRSADLLLLLAQRQPLSVPNKVYEYFGMQKPILAVADREGETMKLMGQIGGHFLIGENEGPEAIERALADAVATAGDPRPASPVLASIATDAQMHTLTTWLAARFAPHR